MYVASKKALTCHRKILGNKYPTENMTGADKLLRTLTTVVIINLTIVQTCYNIAKVVPIASAESKYI